MIYRWKEIFVAVLDANLGVEIERDHTAHFLKDLQEFGGCHVFIVRVGRYPKLNDCFQPAIRLTAAIDRRELRRF